MWRMREYPRRLLLIAFLSLPGSGCHDATGVVDVEGPWKAIVAGPTQTCGITVEGQAYCWAGKFMGEGGPCCEGAKRRVTMGDSPITEISGGEQFTCAVDDSGQAWCWGVNDKGQLGNPDVIANCAAGNSTDPRACSPAAVPVSGSVRFGSITAGYDHACGIALSGEAYCWGAAGGGQFGTGNMTASYIPVAVPGGLRFTQLLAGSGFTCGLIESQEAYCWVTVPSASLEREAKSRHSRPRAWGASCASRN